MTTALDDLCLVVERSHEQVNRHSFPASCLRDAVREIRTLQREHAGSRCELEAREVEKTSLREQRDRAVASVHGMKGLLDQMAQIVKEVNGEKAALMQVIECERAASRPVTVYATDAVVKFSSDGSVSIVAPCVEINGTVPA